MKQTGLVAAVIVCLLCVGTLPVQAYGGHSISRAEIDNFILTDQNGDNWSLEENSEKINVVSFIFTACPDVCPVLTQNLKAVQENLPKDLENDVLFISISVDPARDTPEVLTEYMQLHGVEWPHLTGDNATLEDIWNTFGVVVQRDVIDSHAEAREGENHHHEHEDMGFDEPKLYFGIENNSMQELDYSPNGWTMFNLVSEDAGWSFNYSTSQYGNLVSSINGYESPEDWSWWWSLKIWNESSSAWEDSAVGIDSVDAAENKSIAWVASNANASLIESPVDAGIQVQVIYPDNTTANHVKDNFTAYDLTYTSFSNSEINFSAPMTQYGHYLESADDLQGPSDYSWWWRLAVWNESANMWEESQVGMDDLLEPGNIAWTPSYIDLENITKPGENLEQEEDCDGHGWIMGQGSGMHCMCDDGYQWPEDNRLSCVSIDSEDEYFVGHSTLTYILNEELKPMIVWAGDDWSPEDFTSDLEEFGISEGVIESDGSIIPFLGASSVIALIGASAVMLSRKTKIS